jgi:hypothetical protein
LNFNLLQIKNAGARKIPQSKIKNIYAISDRKTICQQIEVDEQVSVGKFHVMALS